MMRGGEGGKGGGKVKISWSVLYLGRFYDTHEAANAPSIGVRHTRVSICPPPSSPRELVGHGGDGIDRASAHQLLQHLQLLPVVSQHLYLQHELALRQRRTCSREARRVVLGD